MVIASVITLFCIGVTASAILGVASRVFYVEEDPRIEAVIEALPGSNCGGCGYAGCASYAEAVLKNPEVPANLCVAGNDKTIQDVGALTGKAAEACAPRMSFRRCAKTEGVMKQRFTYGGVASCAAAALMEDGTDQCTYSCLGLADCLRACPFDAIVMKEGMATIIVDRCVACGKCIPACPRNVLELVPHAHRVMIFCGTQNKGKAAMDSCSVGCINCNACIRKCPAQAISTQDGRISVDHAACLAYGAECDEVCTDVCPRNILRPTYPATIERKRIQKQEAAAKKAAEAAAKKAAATAAA